MNIHDKASLATLERLQGRSALYNIGLEIAEEAAHKKPLNVAEIYDRYSKLVQVNHQSEHSRITQISKLRVFMKAGHRFGHHAPKAIREWRRKHRNVEMRGLLAYLTDALQTGTLPPIP